MFCLFALVVSFYLWYSYVKRGQCLSSNQISYFPTLQQTLDFLGLAVLPPLGHVLSFTSHTLPSILYKRILRPLYQTDFL